MKEIEKGKWDIRYFADDPKKKVYAVDTYVSLCKVIMVEASSQEEADNLVREQVEEMIRVPNEMEVGHILADNGFHDCEDIDTCVSGEADEDGEIEYY